MTRRLTISLVLTFAAACLYYRGGLPLLPVFLLPVAAHELSHLAALRLLGQRLTGLRPEAGGLCIRYAGARSAAAELAAALAGPLGGLLYAVAADRTGIDWLSQSAGLSLLLSAFNLLPILPLDGWRVFLCLGELSIGETRARMLCRAVSGVLLALFLMGGVLLAVWKKSTAPLAAGIWLLLLQNEREPLANNGKIG